MDWAQKDQVVGCLVISRRRVPEATVALMSQTLAAMRQDGTLEAIFFAPHGGRAGRRDGALLNPRQAAIN
ncbi:hypothetical protein LP420_35100 [Massilia sp. B-10]|nr:hypothetical protein LP420_35100 [Massilia sp. B-10]